MRRSSRSTSPTPFSLRFACAVTVALSLTAPVRSAGAAVDLSQWVTDGGVSAVVPDGGTLFVGGGFARIGPVTGSGVPISTSTFQRVAGFPRVIGNVSAVAGDGAGGWYLGGTFTMVGGVARQGLAHITGALTVDAWSPSTDGDVVDLVVTPTDVVICGTFNTVNGLARPKLAKISRTTGLVAAWAPSPDDQVLALASDGTTLYVAGSFGLISATTRAGLAAFTLATDALTTWDPAATSISPKVMVNDIALANGYIYVAGNFNHIGGQDWLWVAALRPGNANATGWHVPSYGNPTRVLPIGDRVILGGFAFLAAADTASGALLPWAPNIGPPGAPGKPIAQILALESLGDKVAVGGWFTSPAFCFAVIDTAAGAASSVVPMPTRDVRALARQGGELFVGGLFTSLGATHRQNLAAFDIASGALLPWAPHAISPQSEPFGGHGSVGSVAVDATRVYAVVTFVDIYFGYTRSQVRAFSRANAGTVWQVDSDKVVNALAYRSGRVYAGGDFTYLGGARTNLAAFDAATGALQSWAPNPDSPVYELLALDDALVVGGNFANVGGQPRTRLAQLDYASGVATSWNPGADGAVYALARAGSALYAGGDFANAGGQARARVAALDLGSNAALPWNPGADNSVFALATDGVNVYAGGWFLTFAGQPASRFAGVTAAGATPLPWNASPNSGVGALALANGKIYLGGGFSAVDTEPVSSLAAVFDPALLEVPPPPKLTSLRLAVGPSPLRGAGHVSFTLERDAVVSLSVFDVTGRVARTLLAGERRAAGPQRVALDGAGLAPGVYHVQLRHDEGRSAARFIVLP